MSNADREYEIGSGIGIVCGIGRGPAYLGRIGGSRGPDPESDDAPDPDPEFVNADNKYEIGMGIGIVCGIGRGPAYLGHIGGSCGPDPESDNAPDPTPEFVNGAVMQMTVNETIRRFPATVEIFNRYGIDACCGGAAPVEEAAERDGADPVALQAELLRVVGEAA